MEPAKCKNCDEGHPYVTPRWFEPALSDYAIVLAFWDELGFSVYPPYFRCVQCTRWYDFEFPRSWIII